MKSWKTTLFGSLGAIFGALATQVPDNVKPYMIAGATVSGILFASFTKDSNVTGGTVDQNQPK